MKVVLIDTDVSGHRSVLDLIQNGQVVAYPCKDLAAAEGVMWGLVRGQIEADLVVLDTATRMGNTTIQDTVIPANERFTKSVAANLADITPSRNDYGKSGGGVTHVLRGIFELPMPSIFVAHERVREDPMTGTDKFTPDLQGMVLSNVVAWADAIVRMTVTRLPMQVGEYLVPAGTRQLLTQPTSDSAIGLRAWPPPPPFILNPTLRSFIDAAGGTLPHLTIVYGAPKIGKTTFAVGAER